MLAIRRLKNTSDLVNMKIRLAIVDVFAGQLMMSGYGHDQARRIITGGLLRYEDMKDRAAGARGYTRAAGPARWRGGGRACLERGTGSGVGVVI